MRAIYQLCQAPTTVSLGLSLIVFVVIVGLHHLGALIDLELTAYDFLLRSRQSDALPDSRVVLLTITDDDIEAQGQWPFPDELIAQALERLIEYQPRAIGLDLYRDLPIAPGSASFDKVLSDNPSVIVITKVGMADESSIGPPKVLAGTEQVASNDVVLDSGGVVRRGLLFLDDGQQIFYSFALRLALLYLQDEGITPAPDAANPSYIRLGPKTIAPFEANDGGYVNADARGYQFLLDFRGAPQPFPSVSFRALLVGDVPPETIQGKVVIIGVTVSEGVKDFFFSPFSHGQYRDQRMAGITLHAHSVSQLLRTALGEESMIRTVDDLQETLWFLAWSVLGGLVGLWSHSLWRFAMAVSGGLILLGLLVYAAMQQGWWLPVIPAAFAWLPAAALVTAYLQNQEKQQRTLLMHLFSRHVSPEVAETIWNEREQFLEAG